MRRGASHASASGPGRVFSHGIGSVLEQDARLYSGSAQDAGLEEPGSGGGRRVTPGRGDRGVRRRPFPPRPSGPRIIASSVGFPERRSLPGLRRKPLQALLGIKLNIWTLCPSVSSLLSPLPPPRRSLRQNQKAGDPHLPADPTPEEETESCRFSAPGGALAGTYPQQRSPRKPPAPIVTPGAERRLSAAAPRLA